MNSKDKERPIHKTRRSIWKRLNKLVRVYVPDSHVDGILLKNKPMGVILGDLNGFTHFIGKDVFLAWSEKTD